jgi:hypothetical protein
MMHTIKRQRHGPLEQPAVIPANRGMVQQLHRVATALHLHRGEFAMLPVCNDA